MGRFQCRRGPCEGETAHGRMRARERRRTEYDAFLVCLAHPWPCMHESWGEHSRCVRALLRWAVLAPLPRSPDSGRRRRPAEAETARRGMETERARRGRPQLVLDVVRLRSNYARQLGPAAATARTADAPGTACTCSMHRWCQRAPLRRDERTDGANVTVSSYSPADTKRITTRRNGTR